MGELLFVYGSLRRGQPLHRHLAGEEARLLGEGTIRGRLFDLGEYPAAIGDTKRFSTVRGEVHELLDAPRTLEVLDDIEGYDPQRPEKSLFERRLAEVRLEDGRRVRAWVYFYRLPLLEATEIPDGDYGRYSGE
jgi:gamma-glutamylcyclotransferase (GGCT)/AIG2-like uncharacterized protein YtfP